MMMLLCWRRIGSRGAGSGRIMMMWSWFGLCVVVAVAVAAVVVFVSYDRLRGRGCRRVRRSHSCQRWKGRSRRRPRAWR